MGYTGFRLRNGTCRICRNGRKLSLRLDLINHSPTGFEWGYGGSGPAQSALAILADYLHDDPRAIDLHQKFKREVIAMLKHGDWSITDKFLQMWLNAQDEPEAA
jgi:hypothetical protein